MIATPPPRLANVSLRWIAVGTALIGPWIWLVVLDRLLRRKVRSASAQAR
jgi:hypothetical protein